MINRPPPIAAGERAVPVRSQSTMATRKMVRLVWRLDLARFLCRVGGGLQSGDGGEDWRGEGNEDKE